MSAATPIDLDDVAPWGTISAGMRGALLEAARVMLDKFHGTIPQQGRWTTGSGTVSIEVAWTPATTDMRSTHANDKDATEDGAYALAVHLTSQLGLRVLGRAPQGSGAEWYVEDPAAPGKLMKLEVSGIASGGSPGSRLNQKVEQGMGGTITAPGLAVVFRFADVSAYSRSW